MNTIDMHERLKRSLNANLVLCDQVDEQEKAIAQFEARWDYIKTDTDGARALLLLLQNEKGTADDFDTMVDRIIESRANDHQHRRESVTIPYYRPEKVNPRWYEIFTDDLDNEVPVDEILDQIAELSCGIKVGASDECQRYAKHVRAHIEAAYRLGKAIYLDNGAMNTD